MQQLRRAPAAWALQTFRSPVCTSVFGGKADISHPSLQCPLMTQSGHAPSLQCDDAVVVEVWLFCDVHAARCNFRSSLGSRHLAHRRSGGLNEYTA